MDGIAQANSVPWCRHAEARSLLLLGYLPLLAALNLGWETAHVPLYTLWSEAPAGYIAYSIVHCTLGDILIGSAAVVLALIAGREQALERWRWGRIAALTAAFGTVYTAFSEWVNTKVLGSWAYAKAMPTLELAHIEIGMSPLLQWLLLPPVALYLSRKAWEPRWSRQG